jgi:hypothetical protein
MTHAGLSYRRQTILPAFIWLSKRAALGPQSGPGTSSGPSRASLAMPRARASRLPQIRVLALALLFLVGAASHALAQTTSTIEGKVKDANGAAIVGATIKVTGSELATERSATTNSNGAEQGHGERRTSRSVQSGDDCGISGSSAVENGAGRTIPFGHASQVLPGREGQIGFRIEF